MQKTITVEAEIRYEGKWCISDECQFRDHSGLAKCILFNKQLRIEYIPTLLPQPQFKYYSIRCRACLEKTGDV